MLDMVVWNEVAVMMPGQVVTGYPHGPVNLPMYSILTKQHAAVCDGACQQVGYARGVPVAPVAALEPTPQQRLKPSTMVFFE